MSESFADVLEQYIEERGQSSGRIATLSNIPKQTIQSWREGRVKRPRHIDPILYVAKALRLDVAETDRLLMAARHPSIAVVREAAENKNDEALLNDLSFWKESPESKKNISIVTPIVQLRTPFQALSKIDDFVGRRSEIEVISTELKTKSSICVVQGMGGVGKSTLANHLAYHLRDDFKDGVLWSTLAHPSFDQGVRNQHAMTIMRDFAESYGVDVAENSDIESRGRAVRHLLASKQALIILDDALGTEDVRHFLPPATADCSILITTRNKKMLSDRASTYSIRSFSHKDSLALLGNIISEERVRNERNGAIRLIEFIGGLPLALRVIGSAIAEADVITLEEYCELLQDEQSRLEHLTDWEDASKNVRASFELSYGRLQPNQKALFNQLAIFAGRDFSADAVSAIADQPSTLTKITLGRFQSLSLIEFNKNIDEEGANKTQYKQARYHLHPLLRAFASEKLGEPDKTHKQRFATYYAQLVEAYGHDHKGYPLFDQEWENIQVALDWASENGWEEILYQLISGITYPHVGTIGYLDARGYWNEAMQWLQQCIDTPTVKQNKLFLASCYMRYGLFANYLSQLPLAKDSLLKSYALIDEPTNEQETICYAYACMRLSQLMTEEGLEEMLTWSQKGIEATKRFDSLEMRHLQGYLLVNQGSIWGREGDLKNAYELIQQGVVLLPDYPTTAKIDVYCNLGIIAHHETGTDEAEPYWRHALNEVQQLGNVQATLHIWDFLGNMSMCKGDFLGALSLYEQMIEQFRLLELSDRYLNAYANMGDTLVKLGRIEEATEKVEEVVVMAQRLQSISACVPYLARANLQIYTENLSTAMADLEESERLSLQHRTIFRLGFIIARKAEVALLNKNFEDALSFIEQSLTFNIAGYEKGIVLRIKGDVLLALERFDDAMTVYEESKTILEKRHYFEYMRVLTMIAKLDWLKYKNKDVIKELEGILQAFSEMGTVREVARVRKLINEIIEAM